MKEYLTKHRRVMNFIGAFRDSHSQGVAFTKMFTQGQCYSFFEILRAVFPEAECWYSDKAGHVYTRIDGRFYDIRGHRHGRNRPPDDIKPMDWSKKPHRWGRDDRRVLLDSKEAEVVGKLMDIYMNALKKRGKKEVK